MDISYDGTWGYHPLLDLAGQHRRAAVPGQSQRQPPLARAGRRVPRPGHRPVPPGRLSRRSCCGATPTSPRPSTWTAGTPPATCSFVFGIDAMPNPRSPGRRAAAAESYSCLERPPKYEVKTAPRQRPEQRQGADRRRAGLQERSTLLEEKVAEFDYRPVACQQELSGDRRPQDSRWRQGQMRLFEEYRYFFYITNDRSDSGRGDRVLGQRPLRPGEPDRAAQERGAGADDAGGQSGEQLGVHGDGQPGLDPEGLERPD